MRLLGKNKVSSTVFGTSEVKGSSGPPDVRTMLNSLEWLGLDNKKPLVLTCLLGCNLLAIAAVSGFVFGSTYINQYFQNDTKLETEVTHVAFLKVHKTGSSTVQNIFIRFGHRRNLTFILASKKHNECDNNFNCISFKNSITSTNIVPPPENKTFEIMCSHVVYNKTKFKKYLPSDTRYIGLVREPVRRLESAIAFFGLLRNVPFSKFAEHPAAYNHAMLNNRMAFEFGFRKEWFPSLNHTHVKEYEMKQITEYVQQVTNDFTIIIINERLDESLVLMKRLLHWQTSDIIYHSKLRRNHASFTRQDSEKLRQYLYLDYMIYKSAQQTLDNKISEAGPDFGQEVKEFNAVNKRVVHFCNERGSNSNLSISGTNPTDDSNLTISGTNHTDQFTVDRDFCANLLREEVSYLERVRTMMYGTRPQQTAFKFLKYSGTPSNRNL